MIDLRLQNAEGYCRKCGASLGISGQCVVCAVESLPLLNITQDYTAADVIAAVEHECPEVIGTHIHETQTIKFVTRDKPENSMSIGCDDGLFFHRIIIDDIIRRVKLFIEVVKALPNGDQQ